MKTKYNNVWLKQKKLRVFSIRNFMKTGSLLTFWESQNYVMSWIRFNGYHYTKWTSWNSSSREWEWKAVHTVLYFDRLTTNISPETQQFNTNDKSSGKKNCETWFCFNYVKVIRVRYVRGLFILNGNFVLFYLISWRH